MWKPKELKTDSRMDYVWYAVNENEPVKYGPFICKQDAVDQCVKLNNEIQTETPEEKEALDRISTMNPKPIVTDDEALAKMPMFDTTNAQFESLAVEVNSKPMWCCGDTVYRKKDSEFLGCYVGRSQAGTAVIDLCNGSFDDIPYNYIVNMLPETPEQKAAREREEEIEKMTDIAFEGEGTDLYEMRWACTVLYDAGYRKPE